LYKGDIPAGRQTVIWNCDYGNGTKVNPGIYFYRVIGSGEFSRTGKIIVN
jgi:hypothetical protein